MLWNWLLCKESELFKPVKHYLSGHLHSAFRVLLFGGDLLILAVFWSIQRTFPHHAAYDLWLAGLAVTLGMLSIFALGSAHITSHQRYHDPWVELAIVMMFALGLVSAFSAI